MGKRIDLTGQTFGNLTTVRWIGRDSNGGSVWECLCTCGTTTARSIRNMKNGRTTSCGCFRRSATSARARRHGHAIGPKTPEYRSYSNAKQRCEYLKHPDRENYGGRGIEFRFRSFEEFLAHIGPRPPRTTIDRIDGNGHYEPGNVRWATYSQQRLNQRRQT